MPQKWSFREPKIAEKDGLSVDEWQHETVRTESQCYLDIDWRKKTEKKRKKIACLQNIQ